MIKQIDELVAQAAHGERVGKAEAALAAGRALTALADGHVQTPEVTNDMARLVSYLKGVHAPPSKASIRGNVFNFVARAASKHGYEAGMRRVIRDTCGTLVGTDGFRLHYAPGTGEPPQEREFHTVGGILIEGADLTFPDWKRVIPSGLTTVPVSELKISAPFGDGTRNDKRLMVLTPTGKKVLVNAEKWSDALAFGGEKVMFQWNDTGDHARISTYVQVVHDDGITALLTTLRWDAHGHEEQNEKMEREMEK